jgi:hypothetical protein
MRSISSAIVLIITISVTHAANADSLATSQAKFYRSPALTCILKEVTSTHLSPSTTAIDDCAVPYDQIEGAMSFLMKPVDRGGFLVSPWSREYCKPDIGGTTSCSYHGYTVVWYPR